VSDGGRVWLFGNRIGDMNGLEAGLSEVNKRSREEALRIVELSHLRKTVHHFVGSWPREIWRIVLRSRVYVCRRVLDDEVAIFLLPS